jgi:hypothetical protein
MNGFVGTTLSMKGVFGSGSYNCLQFWFPLLWQEHAVWNRPSIGDLSIRFPMINLDYRDCARSKILRRSCISCLRHDATDQWLQPLCPQTQLWPDFFQCRPTAMTTHVICLLESAALSCTTSSFRGSDYASECGILIPRSPLSPTSFACIDYYRARTNRNIHYVSSLSIPCECYIRQITYTKRYRTFEAGKRNPSLSPSWTIKRAITIWQLLKIFTRHFHICEIQNFLESSGQMPCAIIK